MLRPLCCGSGAFACSKDLSGHCRTARSREVEICMPVGERETDPETLLLSAVEGEMRVVKTKSAPYSFGGMALLYGRAGELDASSYSGGC